MYGSSHSASAAAAAAAAAGAGAGAPPVNGGVGGNLVVDGSGTINPAALNNGMSFFFFFFSCLFELVVVLVFSFGLPCASSALLRPMKSRLSCRAPPN